MSRHHADDAVALSALRRLDLQHLAALAAWLLLLGVTLASSPFEALSGSGVPAGRLPTWLLAFAAGGLVLTLSYQPPLTASRRAQLLAASLRALGLALALPVLVWAALLPLSVATLPALASSAAAHGLALIGLSRAAAELGVVRRHRRARRARAAALARKQRAVEAALAAEPRVSPLERSWTRVQDAEARDAHHHLRAGDIRVQLYEGLAQIWHRNHRLGLDTEGALLRDVPRGLELTFERPDRYLVIDRGAPAEAFARLVAQVVGALTWEAVRSDPVVPLQGDEPPMRRAAPLVLRLRSPRGEPITWTLADAQLSVRGPGAASVDLDLDRPFRIQLGHRQDPRRGAMLHLTLRQREIAAAAPEPEPQGLMLDPPSTRWLEAKLCVALDTLPPELAGRLLAELAPAPRLESGAMAFTALWCELYWRAQSHGVELPSLPQRVLRCEQDLGAALELTPPTWRELERRPRVVGAAVGTACAAAVATAAAMVLVHESAHLLSGAPRRLASLELLAVAGAALASVGWVAWALLRPISARQLLARAAADAAPLVSALEPDFEPERDTLLPQLATVGAVEAAGEGLRLEAVMHPPGPFWATLTLWPTGRGLFAPRFAEQLELHARMDDERGQHRARELVHLQRELIAARQHAVLMRTDEVTTLVLQVRRGALGAHAPWGGLAAIAAGRADAVPPSVQLAAPAWPSPPRAAAAILRDMPSRNGLRILAMFAMTLGAGMVLVLSAPSFSQHSTRAGERPRQASVASAPSEARARSVQQPRVAAPRYLTTHGGLILERVAQGPTPLYVTEAPIATIRYAPGAEHATIVPRLEGDDLALCVAAESDRAAADCLCRRVGLRAIDSRDALLARVPQGRERLLPAAWAEWSRSDERFVQCGPFAACEPPEAQLTMPLYCWGQGVPPR